MKNAFRATGEPASEARIDAAFAAYVAAYEQAPVAGSALFPGVHAALDGLLARGTRLAVCTNKPEGLAETVLETFGLAGYLRGRGRGRHAPDQEAVARTPPGGRSHAPAGRGDLPRWSEDSPIDADAARAASIPFIAVSFGYSPVPASALGADAVIDGYDELAGAIDGLNGVRT